MVTVMPRHIPFKIRSSCIPHPPFEFINFVATRQDDNTVKLAFETNNEFTNRSFTIERVYAAGTEHAEILQPTDSSYQLFLKANKLTAFVQPDSVYAKNKRSNTTYKLTDHNAYTGLSFYRITASDFYTSDIVATQIIAVQGKPLKETVGVYPNPAVSNASITLFSKYAGSGMVQLVTVKGNVVKQFPADILAGVNNLPLNTAGLATGMYIVRVVRKQHPVLQTNMMKQ